MSAHDTAVGGDVPAAADGSAGPSGETVGAWLERRLADAPPALRARILDLLAPHLPSPVSELPEAAMHTGEAMLAALLAEQATDRTSALELLAVDALFTYAFEAAADAPETLLARAEAAMRRVADIPAATRPGQSTTDGGRPGA